MGVEIIPADEMTDPPAWLLGREFSVHPAWLRLAQHARATTAFWASFTEPDGRPCLVPVTRVDRGRPHRLTMHVSSAFGTYGGPITPSPMTISEATTALEMLQHHLRAPVTCLLGPRFTGPTHGEQHASTHLVSLDDDDDARRARYTKNRRWEVRRAIRDGVRVRTADTEAGLDAYISAYRASLARWGSRASSQHDPSLLRALWAHARTMEEPRIRLWLAERDAEVLAGAIVIDSGGTAYYWHGASTEQGLQSYAPAALLDAVMCGSRRRGLSSFDMLPSGGHKGVADFKRRFGAQEVPLQLFTVDTRLSAHVRRVRTAWRRG